MSILETIIEANEKAFVNRYCISLQGKWNMIGEVCRNGVFGFLSEQDEVSLSNSFSFEKSDILRIIIGFGGRCCLRKILSDTVMATRVIVWEPEEALFFAYCTKEDISDIISNPNLFIVLGQDTSKLKTVLEENIFDNNAYHRKIIALGEYADGTGGYACTLSEIVTSIISNTLFRGFTRKAFNKVPCRNMLSALRILDNNYVISQLFGAVNTRDIPIIIVGAGPSVMKNMHDLEKAHNKALIIAASHAMKILYHGGIKPDIVALSDPMETDFLQSDDEVKDRQMILSSVYADSSSCLKYSGSIIYFGFTTVTNIFSNERTLSEKYAELFTGSVTTEVFSLFLSAGFKNFILVGQDLAYGESGFTHAGFETEDMSTFDGKKNIEVPGIYSDTVLTREDWLMFRNYYERRIEENKGLNIIDATEGGARIKGTKVMTLSDAIDRYCTVTYPVDRWFDSLSVGGKAEKEDIDKWFYNNTDDINSIERYLEEAVILNESIRKKWNDLSGWDDDFKASCKRYDILYNQILDGSRGALLRFYCAEEITEYVENALSFEGDENIENRMQIEYVFFSLLKDRADELVEYIYNLNQRL